MEERGASRHRPRRFDRRELAVLWVATAAAVSMFTLLTVLVWHSRGPVRLDNAGRRLALSHRVESFLGAHYLSGLKGKGVSDAVVWLGSPRFVGVVTIILVVASIRWRDKVGVVLAVIGPVLAGVLVEGVLKPVVDRHLHGGGGLMFPSGHTAGATAVAAVASIVVYRRCNRGRALLFSLVSAAAVVSVGFSLVRLGLHFATDVVGGAAVAVAVVLGLTGVLSAMLDPRPRPAPEPAHNRTVGAQHVHR